MKKTLLITIFAIFLLSLQSFSQKVAVVDTKYILDNIPEYKAAQKELDQLAIQWQKEIEAKFKEVADLYETFRKEEILLPEDVKKNKQDEIIQKEKEAKALQKQRFGTDGDLAKKRKELIKPIQDKVYEAIKQLAKQRSLDIIFDKTSQVNVLYADERYDKSDEVLKAMGYTPGQNTDEED